MNTKIIALTIVGILIVGGGSFYAGLKYAGANTAPRNMDFTNQDQGGQFRSGQNGPSTGGRMGQGMGGVTVGEIIAKDDTSITVKLQDGGSRMVFFTESTTVTKSAAGSTTDLMIDENVIVNGSANSDGSINAQSIQLGSGMQFTNLHLTP